MSIFKPLNDPAREVAILPKPKDSGADLTPAPLPTANPSQPPQQKETENE